MQKLSLLRWSAKIKGKQIGNMGQENKFEFDMSETEV